MSKKLFLILLLIIYTSLVPSATTQEDTIAPEVRRELADTGQAGVIITFHDPVPTNADDATRRAAVTQLQNNLVATLPGFELIYRYTYIPALAGTITTAHLGALDSKPYVKRVEYNFPVQASLAEARQLIDANSVYNLGYTGASVRVAILDTGIDTDHPDLQGAIVAQRCYNSTPPPFNCPPADTATSPNAEDEHGHGTNVAGIIASRGNVSPRGIAPGTEIVAVRVLNQFAAGTVADMVAGLDYVRGLGGPGSPNHVHIVNISIGSATTYAGTCDTAVPSLANAVSQLTAQGTVIIAASGNSGSLGGISAPGCLSQVISVGAVYDADVGARAWTPCTDTTTAPDQLACFTNRSANLDLLAPGAMIEAAGIGGGVSQLGGTSQAAPMVAAATAVLFQAAGAMSRGQVLQTLQNTGISIYDTGTGLTFRRIDLYRALQAVLPKPLCQTRMPFRSIDPAPVTGELRFYTRFGYDPAFQVEGWLEDTLPVTGGTYTEGTVEVTCGTHVRAWLFDQTGALVGLVPSQYENGDGSFTPYDEDYGAGDSSTQLNPVYAGRYAGLLPVTLENPLPAVLQGVDIVKNQMGNAIEWGFVRNGVYTAFGWSWESGDGSIGCSVPETGPLSLPEFCALSGGTLATETGEQRGDNKTAAPVGVLGYDYTKPRGEIRQTQMGDAVEWGLVQDGVYITLGWSWDTGENLIGCSIPDTGPWLMTVEEFCAFVTSR